jgi:hypothetical protein
MCFRLKDGHTSEVKIAELNTREQSDGNWSSFQLAKSTPPQSVIDYAIAPSARIHAEHEPRIYHLHVSDDSVMVRHKFLRFGEGRQCEKECKSRLAIASPTQASGCRNPGKNFMTLEIFQVGRISVVILIRTDTTLDHSQEAEKVCWVLACSETLTTPNQTTLCLRVPHIWLRSVWAEPRKNSEIRNDAPFSRQPLVKGERLVRSESGAAMTSDRRV